MRRPWGNDNRRRHKLAKAGSEGELRESGGGQRTGRGSRMRHPSLRGDPACARTRGVEAEMAPRGRASWQRAEVGVRAEVAGWSRGLGGDRACR